jgi:polyhydroxyalkanoate synthase subunit PhaC
MELMPTPRDVVLEDGPAQLLRFRSVKRSDSAPVLLIPSLINRWYVLDLRRGASLAEALTAAGLDVWLLDWGIPQDEDRYWGWDDLFRRLSRMHKRVRRETGAEKLSTLGYCMGATVSGIHAALEPKTIASFVNLLGPFDFAQGGLLSRMTDPRWFDAGAVADAGNVAAVQMQSGFQLLRPTATLAKWVSVMEKGMDPAFREGYDALEAWASDNIPFPAAAYRTYIEELYQKNALVQGQHHALGRRVDLKAVDCPVLTITASRDTICPPTAALGLASSCGAAKTEHLEVPGGHVGAVVGSRAARELYPRVAEWFSKVARA